MREKQSTLTNYKIIRFLLDGKITNITEIGEAVDLSDKTIRNRLKTIDEFLQENNTGKIHRKPRIGVWLEADEKQIVKLLNLTSEVSTFNIATNVDTRVYDMKNILLKDYDGSGILLTKLAQTLYMSVSTTTTILKEVEEEFKSFNLKIENVRNQGIRIVGDELNYRNALKEFIFETNDTSIEESLIDYYSFIDTHLLKKIISETEFEWGISFDEYSFNQVLITMAIAIVRNKYADQMVYEPNEVSIIEQYNEYNFAQALINKISNYTGIQFIKETNLYLAIHILCSRVVDYEKDNLILGIASDLDKNLATLAKEMILTVGNVLNVDFTGDMHLYNSLLQHLRPMIFRLKYGILQDNTLLKQIRQDYKQVYRAVWSISVLFEEYYNLNITENELGFITIYFESALQRMIPNINMILVTKRNASYAQLLSQNLKRSINVKNEIDIIFYHEFVYEDYPDTDIILTTDELHVESERIIEVNDLYLEKSVELIEAKIKDIIRKQDAITTKFDLLCHQMIDPELIFIKLKANSKADVFHAMNKVLLKKKFVTPKYVETVFNHEAIAVTEISNGIAIPHGSQHEVLEAKVAIATLEKPVLWNEEYVDLVFLLVVKMTSQTEIEKSQLFYKGLIRLIDSDEKIENLKNMKSSIELYNYLVN